MTSARYNTSPFTAVQYQELEHQALIYKYISSGVPVPPELIYSVKLSLDSSHLFLQQPIGSSYSSWEGCFQMGFGRKADPEPWRCRRTDGKKWRCSKEAHTDSKYCEKHMHRGKNRSRKHVEPPSSSSLTPKSTSLNTTSSPHSLSYPFLHTHNTATTHQLFLDSKNYKNHRDSMDKGYFVQETSGSGGLPYYSGAELQNMKDKLKNQEDEQTSFLWGTEFKSPRETKIDDPTQKPLHHFFGEWTPKDADSWL